MTEPTLAEFLNARYDETQTTAEGVWPTAREWEVGNGPRPDILVAGNGDVVADQTVLDGAAEHIVQHDPARVLAEVQAKQRIVTHAEHWAKTLHETPEGWTPETCTAYRMAMEWTLTVLATAHADHPDYQPAWSADA